MVIELFQVKEIRKRLGLTQSGFAKQAGVSQSLIAKIEAGRIDPSYSKAKQILDALDSMGKKKEAKAKDIMTRHIISARSGEEIREVISRMKKSSISQMPVIENNKSIGIVTESIVLEALMKKKGSIVRDIMEDSAPVVSQNTSLTMISNLLRFCPMVLVSEDGELNGIITKSDLLGKMFS